MHPHCSVSQLASHCAPGQCSCSVGLQSVCVLLNLVQYSVSLQNSCLPCQEASRQLLQVGLSETQGGLLKCCICLNVRRGHAPDNLPNEPATACSVLRDYMIGNL